MYTLIHSPYDLCYERFEYLTPRLRITPNDLQGTKLEKPQMLHFICSPERASAICSEIQEIQEWRPTTIYEPIPVCYSFFMSFLEFSHDDILG